MQKRQNNLNTTVVVRSVGEATESACVGLLEEIFGRENVFLVKNVSPFSKAVEKTLEIGIALNKKWTLAIDADVLVFQDKIPLFIELANKHVYKRDRKAFCLEGKLFDKFSGFYREVGLHLFQTKLLEKAINFAKKGTYELRPEFFVKANMMENGYMFYISNLRLGIHDFFQHPEFIVKKAILHCKKHYNAAQMVELWRKNLNIDSDFHWAMKGAEIAENLRDINIVVDSVFMGELVKKYISDFKKNEQERKIDRKVLDKILSNYNKKEEAPVTFIPF